MHEGEAAHARLVTPAAKYWICKTAPSFIYEAMECLGGNGYLRRPEGTPLLTDAVEKVGD
jgi:alkylation response protein AidB-like acyl-CoA dehydrogenase